ncbi:MAG TPA: SDR family oxidoreductase [Thermoanaerobaculia bacterium]|nr:SDR family oxidoreductase [Thermoanaerobaculia bacterium]
MALALAAGFWLGRKTLAWRRRIRFRDKAVLLTGGSRGLGLAMARRLAREGARLALVARDPRELDAAAGELATCGVEVLPIVADLTVEGDAERAVEETLRAFRRLDVLINNAGIIQVGPLDSLTLGDFDRAMATHFGGPLRLILAALPHLEASGAGRLVNVSSIGGRIAVPHMAPYCASKFALTGLSEALRAELAERGVLVTTVTPGLMRTGSYLHAMFKGRRGSELDWFGVSSSLPLLTMNADRAAKKILAACREGRPTLTLTPQARAAEIVDRLLPGATARITELASAVLPAPPEDGEAGIEPVPGHRLSSRWTQSPLTLLGRRAARRNRELPPPPPGVVPTPPAEPPPAVPRPLP